jgi:hypothetical protein
MVQRRFLSHLLSSFFKQQKSKFKSSKHLPTYSHGVPPILHNPCSTPKKQHHTKALLFPLSLAFFSLFSSFHIGYKDSTFLEAPTPSHDASTPPFFASINDFMPPNCHLPKITSLTKKSRKVELEIKCFKKV